MNAYTLVQDKMASLQEAIEFISTKYDQLLNNYVSQEQKIENLTRDNTLLKSQVASLQNEFKQEKEALNDLEQYSRRECLEIKGIPVVPDEDTNKIVTQVGSLLDVEIGKGDISVSHRNPSKGKRDDPHSIIVKFTRRDVRDKLYKAKKKLKAFTTANLSLQTVTATDNKIFISESLTKTNKDLFNKALDLRKELNFKFIWTSYGKIFIRKNADSPVRKITSLKDLDIIRDLKNKIHSGMASR